MAETAAPRRRRLSRAERRGLMLDAAGPAAQLRAFVATYFDELERHRDRWWVLSRQRPSGRARARTPRTWRS